MKNKVLDPGKPAAGVRGNVLHKIAYGPQRHFIRNGNFKVLFHFQNNINHVQVIETQVLAQVRMHPQLRGFQGFGFAYDLNYLVSNDLVFSRSQGFYTITSCLWAGAWW